MTTGSDLMNQINKGEVTPRSSVYALLVKEEISDALIELMTFGARVRPLFLEDEQVGWVRPFSNSERKQVNLWFPSEVTKIQTLLQFCTTLDTPTINDLDTVELNILLRIITKGHLADLSLIPYISAFASTQVSLNLWKSKGDYLFSPKEITLPDGKKLNQIALSDHLRLWAAASSLREEAISRTEASMNAAIVARSMTGGTGWDSYMNSLQTILNYYAPDSLEPWMNIIDFVSYNTKQSNLDDGFGHSHEDPSTEGLIRELHGMMAGDKHEKLIEQFYNQQLDREKARVDKLTATAKLRREQIEKEVSLEDSYVIRTEKEVEEREREIKEQNYGWVSREHQNLINQSDSEDLSNSEQFERIVKYL